MTLLAHFQMLPHRQNQNRHPTGNVSVEKYFVIEDAGKLINPKIVDGQIVGGVIQGIGNALYEEIKYDKNGTILTTNLQISKFLPCMKRQRYK